MINKTLLQKRFNGAAVSYDRYANVQKKMAHSLLSILKERYSETASIRIFRTGMRDGVCNRTIIKVISESTYYSS